MVARAVAAGRNHRGGGEVARSEVLLEGDGDHVQHGPGGYGNGVANADEEPMEEEGRSAYGFLKAMFARQADPVRGRGPPARAKRAPRAPRSHHRAVPRLPAARAGGRTARDTPAGSWPAWCWPPGPSGVVALAQRRVGWGVAARGSATARWAGWPCSTGCPGRTCRAYSDLFVIWAGTSAVHPPRRSLPVVLTAAAAALDPLHRRRRGRRAGRAAGRPVAAHDRRGLRARGDPVRHPDASGSPPRRPEGWPAWTR